jgi:hypothetical protein
VGRKRGWGAPRKLGSGRCEMAKMDWLAIAQAAQRLGMVSVGDEVINIARDNGVNVKVSPDQDLRPTLQVGGKDVYIILSPHLFERNPKIEITVTGNTFPVKDMLKKEGYRFEGRAWVKVFPVRVGASDEEIIQSLLFAIEEALFVKMKMMLTH